MMTKLISGQFVGLMNLWLHILYDPHSFLEVKVMHFIHDKNYFISHEMNQDFPNLINLLHNVHILKYDNGDYLLWIHFKSDTLTFNDAYLQFSSFGQQIFWTKHNGINTSVLQNVLCVVIFYFFNKNVAY